MGKASFNSLPESESEALKTNRELFEDHWTIFDNWISMRALYRKYGDIKSLLEYRKRK